MLIHRAAKTRPCGLAQRSGHHFDVPLDAGNAPQVLGDERRFPFDLRASVSVLKVTPPTTERMRVGTWW
jgi:hypothetical protein